MAWKNLPGKPPHFACVCGNRLSKDQAAAQAKLREHRATGATVVNNARKALVAGWSDHVKKTSQGVIVMPAEVHTEPVVQTGFDDFLTPDLPTEEPIQVNDEWYPIPDEE